MIVFEAGWSASLAWSLVLLFGVCLPRTPVDLEGQIVRGTVIDAASREPVGFAYLALLTGERRVVVATLSDVEGRFSLTAPGAGSFFLYVARAGYSPLVDGVFELGEEGSFDLSVSLTPTPVALDSMVVSVEARDRSLASVGFYGRRDLGRGHFLEREDIERVAVEDITDAMRRVPGFRVVDPAVTLAAPTALLNPEILVRRGGGYCSPTLYVDGHIVALGSARNGGEAVRPDDFVEPADVEALEIYTRPADTPPRYESTGGCGVVLIWTRVR